MGLIIRLHTLNTTKKESVPIVKISCRKEVIIVSEEKNPTLLKSSLKRREVKHGQAFSSPWLFNIQNKLYVSEFNYLSLCFHNTQYGRNLQSRYIIINTIIS